MTLTRLTGGHDWRLSLCHDRPAHLLIWITRGQGLLHLEGQRRGVGAHNAIFVPAGSLFALDLGRQGFCQAVVIPQGTGLRLPHAPKHLRIRDVHLQSEMTGLIETAQREVKAERPLAQEALEAHVALICIWLRRQILREVIPTERRTAASRLSARFCALVSAEFASGAPMAEYAQKLGVTPTHLSRAVKAATGKTAADLLTERVVYEARQLLAGTPDTAQSVATRLGFRSAAYFTRFMQQHTGHPPSKLRGPKP